MTVSRSGPTENLQEKLHRKALRLRLVVWGSLAVWLVSTAFYSVRVVDGTYTLNPMPFLIPFLSCAGATDDGVFAGPRDWFSGVPFFALVTLIVCFFWYQRTKKAAYRAAATGTEA